MAELIRVERKGDVLGRPALPCLAPYHTVNLTAGCPYECRYCYAQSFRSYPGRGKVKFYANTLESLAKSLPRKKRPPELVYFSTACEPFMPFDEILDCLYGCMELLLKAGSRLLISTKARIPERFIELFARHPGLPHVQMGVTTADDGIRRLMEPDAGSVPDRLETLRALKNAGVACEIRMDPLIPELTDDAGRFDETMRAVAAHGVDRGVMSYLFLRRGNRRRLAVTHGDWSFPEMSGRVFTQVVENYCGNNDIQIPATEYRRAKYAELQAIGRRHGVTLGLCACKNPDVAEACCHPLPDKKKTEAPRHAQRTLFVAVDGAARQPDADVEAGGQKVAAEHGGGGSV